MQERNKASWTFGKPKVYSTFLVLSFLLVPFIGNAFQSKKSKEKAKKEVKVSSAIKEELHRYMGYEDLLPKYISLPYDVTMNTNLRGSFIDIGFLFLLFLPILFFAKLKEYWLKIGVGLLMLLFLIVSFSTGYSAWKQVPLSEVTATIDKELTSISPGDQPLSYLKLKTNRLSDTIYKSIDNNIIQVFSGEGDSITYPIFIVLFVLTFFVLKKRFKSSSLGVRALFLLTFLYFFMWLILGAGVAWYGILLVGLGSVFITVGFLSNEKLKTNPVWFKYIFLLGTFLWLSTSFTYRLSNYYPINAMFSRGAIHEASLNYGLGKYDEGEIMDYLFPNYRLVVTEINDNKDAYVYRIGTYFQYFIDRNNERVLSDNQLGIFEELYTSVPDKVALARGMKESGYEYIIVDLNVASIDLTPEKSLQKKASMLGNFLVNNPALQLIATDRLVEDANGQLKYALSTRNIQNNGTFAAFKIN